MCREEREYAREALGLKAALRKLLQAHSREHLARVMAKYTDAVEDHQALIHANAITEASIEEVVQLLLDTTHTSRG